MKKFLWVLVFLTCTTLSDAAPQLTITSYFPAPSGNYARLRLSPIASLPDGVCTASTVGTIYYDATNKRLVSCQDNGGVYAWSWMEGVWKQLNGAINDDIILTDPLDPVQKRIGIGTQTPEFKLTLDQDGGIIAKGTLGSGRTLTTEGQGTRFIWYPYKAAIRAGHVNNDEWSHDNIGRFSAAFGDQNIASGEYSVVSGGAANEASGNSSTVSGGTRNYATGEGAVIGGGAYTTDPLDGENRASALNSTIGGGKGHLASANYSVIAGGQANQTTGNYSTVSGGQQNHATALGATVAGGQQNTASGDYSFVGGGQSSTASGLNASIVGGQDNLASGDHSFVGGGQNNTADALVSTIGGGADNTASGDFSTISGGSRNSINIGPLGESSVIAGGMNNIITSPNASIGGGNNNTASGDFSTISGGSTNIATGNSASVLGGNQNRAGADNAFVGGGSLNLATGYASMVPGGLSNTAAGDYSFAAGRNMQLSAAAANTFVWGNSNVGAILNSTNSFLIFPSGQAGGVAINTTNPAGAALKVVGLAGNDTGVWSNLSDERLKTNIQPLTGALDKVMQLRGVTFEWKSPEEHGNRTGLEKGFIAQEVEKVFPEWVGTDTNGFKYIEPAGINAVLVEAIQEQQKMIDQQQKEIEELKSKVNKL